MCLVDRLGNGAGLAAQFLGAVKGRIHFLLCFFASHLAGAVLLVLRSWLSPSPQPPLAAPTEGDSVQFAHQSDNEK